jgi:hypothetical protein
MSMYDDKQFFVENDFKRYSIGSTTDGLKTDAGPTKMTISNGRLAEKLMTEECSLEAETIAHFSAINLSALRKEIRISFQLSRCSRFVSSDRRRWLDHHLHPAQPWLTRFCATRLRVKSRGRISRCSSSIRRFRWRLSFLSLGSSVSRLGRGAHGRLWSQGVVGTAALAVHAAAHQLLGGWRGSVSADRQVPAAAFRDPRRVRRKQSAAPTGHLET